MEPEARTSAGNPPARVPWRYPPKGTVYPLLWGRRFLFSLHWFDFHAEDLTHTMVASGIALWESLMGKTRGKATDPLIHETGSVTLLLQFVRKAHVHAPTRDEH